MHRIYLASAVILASLLAGMPFFAAYSAAPPIKINEIEFNPPGAEDGKQSIEIYNQGEDLLDIGGWIVKSTKFGRTFAIPSGFVVLPNNYVIVPFNGVMFSLQDETATLLTPDSVEADRTPLLGDTGDDTLTWQRFPNGIDTDTVADWSLRNSTLGETNGFIVRELNFTLSRPVFIDQEGNKLEAFASGQMAGIKAEVVNRFAEERTFTYIIKVTDENGFTALIGWVEDLVILPNRVVKPTFFWLAGERGNYDVEIFVWRSMLIPEPLAPSQIGVLRVAG